VRVSPRRPQPGERHRLTIAAVNEHGLLPGPAPMPLVEALGRYETAMPPEGPFVRGLLSQRLGAGVDHAVADLRVLRPRRDQPPPQVGQIPATAVVVSPIPDGIH